MNAATVFVLVEAKSTFSFKTHRMQQVINIAAI